VKLLIDNNLPPRLARGLAGLFEGEHEIQHIRARFGTGSLPDEEWIEAIGKDGGWSVLSGDRRIASKRPSRELFLRNNLVGFFPLPAVMKMPLFGMTARILTLWPVIEATTRTMDSGCFEIGVKTNRLRPIG
jgi:hypothetical protein